MIGNDKYTVRRIIDLHENRFNLIKDRSQVTQTQSSFPFQPLPIIQAPLHPANSIGSPSVTSNTDLLEVMSKQALVSNDTDEFLSTSSPEPTVSMFDASSTAFTHTTGPLAAALIHNHQLALPSNRHPSNSSSFNAAMSINERPEMEQESMFTATTSFYKEAGYPTSDSLNDGPPIFRNILHVAIIYGKTNL